MLIGVGLPGLLDGRSALLQTAVVGAVVLGAVGTLLSIGSSTPARQRRSSADRSSADRPQLARSIRSRSAQADILLATWVVATVGTLVAGGPIPAEPSPWWSALRPGIDPTLVRLLAATIVVSVFTIRVATAARDHDRIRAALISQITHDELTRLPNRVHFIGEVAERLEHTWDTEHRATVLRINLDRFKNINDTYGHHVANEVLVVVADRLRSKASTLGATAARVGGDDFALLHTEATTADEALRSADALRSELEQPVAIDGANVFLTASIGVAIAPRHRTTAPEELVRRADIAAHHAKRNGRNRVEVFDESMHDRLTRRMDVEHALHGAIGRREMRLHHQPIIDIVTGSISGFEALMRWERREGSFVSPADFIPVAEETGIICELGAWAIREALGDLVRWIDDGLVPPRTTMSVNVSPRQVGDPGFASIVRAAVEESGASPELLWLEITESMMLDEPDEAAIALAEIRRMGVQIAMDDFGTGYSSLSVLQQFPIQRIKIDRSFVTGLGASADPTTSEGSLVRTIIAMAGAMALDLVAEGVETISQLEQLRRFGCSKAQGFLISRPVPAAAMRSTMVALGELSTLSIFRDDSSDVERAPTAALPTSSTAVQPTARPPVQPSFVGATSGAGRPLGGPTLTPFRSL